MVGAVIRAVWATVWVVGAIIGVTVWAIIGVTVRAITGVTVRAIIGVTVRAIIGVTVWANCNSPLLFAQTGSFDIANYARPDLERRTLNLYTITGFQNDSNKLDSTFSLAENLYYLNGRIYNSKFQNSEKYQKSSAHQARIDFDINKKNNNYAPDFGPANTIIASRLNLGLDYNHYFRHKQFGKQERFFEIDYEVDFYGDYNHHRDTSGVLSLKERSANLTLEFASYIGKGRIEYVNDAWHAKTILEMLAEKGFLKTVASTEQMQAFAEEISTIKNIRNTDPRLEQISEYKQLCNFLVTEKLIDPEAYGFYAVLADAWRYESFTVRNSGREFKFGINPRLNFGDDKYLNDDPAPVLNVAFPVALEYNSYKPISDDWQFNNTNRLEFGPEIDVHYALTDEDKYAYEFRGRLASEWEIGYLPNQRTNYGLSLNLEYRHNQKSATQRLLNPLNIDRYFGKFNVMLTGYFKYYVSPRFTFTINTHLDFFYGHLESDNWSSRNELQFITSYRFY